MVDLSHWDFQDEFDLSEVAALIAGLEPNGSKKLIGKNSSAPFPISRRLLEAAMAAYRCQKCEKPVPAECLQSNMLEVFDKERGVFATITDMALGGDEILVERGEVVRWLDAIGLQSKYVFALKKEAQANKESIDLPLAARERNTLLTIIAALCKEAKIDIKTASKAGDLIQSLTDSMGAPVGKRTIEDHLKKIPDALAGRMK